MPKPHRELSLSGSVTSPPTQPTQPTQPSQSSPAGNYADKAYGSQFRGIDVMPDATSPAGKSSTGSPPPQLFYLGEWFDSAPTEPGMYWFCGDPWFGSWIGDWSGDFSPDVRISLVKLIAVPSGVIGRTEDQFFSLVKFDREHRREGWFGKWCRANVPYACDLSDMKHLLPEKKQ